MCVVDITPKSCSAASLNSSDGDIQYSLKDTDSLGDVQAVSSATFVELLLAAARALCPVIRRFVSLGLNRVWLHAGDCAYQCVLHSLPCCANSILCVQTPFL